MAGMSKAIKKLRHNPKTHRNDAQEARRISFHNKLVRRVLGAQWAYLNMLCDPFFGDEGAVRSVKEVVDVARDSAPPATETRNGTIN